MKAVLTRRLAALQVRAQLLSAQGKLLSDLGDIKECRRLQNEVAAILKDSAARGLIPNNPLEEMLANWRRVVDWSNKVQSRLRDVDALCAEQSRLSDWKAVVSYDWLQRWRDRLSLAPGELERGCSESRGTMAAGDWDQGRVDSDLLTVGTVMAAPLKFERAEEEDSEGEEPGPAEILSSSFRVVQPKSPEVAARLRLIRDTRGKADAALAEFPRQRAALAEMRKLLAAGELTQAESKYGARSVRFEDLDYEEPFEALRERRSRLYKASAELTEAKGSAAQQTSIPRLEEALRRLEMLANGLESKGRETCGEESRLWAALAKEAASAREFTAQHILRARQSERRRLTVLWGGAATLVLVLLLAWAWSHAQAKAEAKKAAAIKAEVERIAAAKAKAEAEARAEAERAAVLKAREEALATEARAEVERVAASKAKAEAEARAQAEARSKAEMEATVRANFFAQIQIEALPEISWSVEGLGAESELEMIPIKGGVFRMGSESGDTDEGPLTEVLLRSFALGKTEVSQAQWEALMVENPSYFRGGDLPVENVSWMAAMQFCRKLTERERAAGKLPAGWEYTLPTEAQWEYACRAGSSGDYSGELREMAWYGENSEAKTHPVGTKKANAWGLHDMHGNVWEWCLDRYQERLEGIQVTEPVGPSSGSMRVNRGGGWGDQPVHCRTTNRSSHPPASRDVKLGFRLALSRVP